TADLVEAKKAAGIEVAPPHIVSRINRLAGRYDDAREILDKELAITPGEPDLLLEKAFLEKETNNAASAQNILEQVLDIYNEADAEFVPAQRARELLESLKSR
ncbi:MAG: tetratricopeptide repeat protein, partial [Bacteroidota bacterium]